MSSVRDSQSREGRWLRAGTWGVVQIPQGEKAARERRMSGTRQGLVREWSGAAKSVYILAEVGRW